MLSPPAPSHCWNARQGIEGRESGNNLSFMDFFVNQRLPMQFPMDFRIGSREMQQQRQT